MRPERAVRRLTPCQPTETRVSTVSSLSCAHPPADLRRAFHGRADAHVRTAATEIALHGGVDIGVAGISVAVDERRSTHELARLAVAALRDVQLGPRLLHGVVGGS